MARILAVDDEKDMLMLIRNALRLDGHSVDIYENPEEVKEDSLKNYDLILLDVMMPKINGLDYCLKIRNLVDCPIIFLTAKVGENDIVNGLGCGADDYITKPFGIDALTARVRAHLRREQREKHSVISADGVRFDLSSKSIMVDENIIPFTKSEYEICEYLVKNKGQVFSREQIYEAVFGFDGESDSSAISEHVKNIRAKFQKVNKAVISTVWGVGYKWT